MSDCIFCKIVKGDIPSHKIYEDNDVLAFLDINPVNEGHTLVIPKEHYENLLETPSQVASKLILAVQKLAPAIIMAVGSSAFNLGVNSGSEAGQLIFHTHIHIIPRFAGDGHHMWRGKRKFDDEQFKHIAEKIKENI